ncbi:hypothetical protein FZI85_19650 [Mycobacterium sp. CBMA293]|uniref:hypothetical protein n=2 Tax=Mycolicibacterium TaxID=1866885 RepID=UPI0012DF0B08|nr:MULTISPECIES: hypothetical protein [unclassified Mycolicibacterium]MUL49088.1 hypothetical protein [Mycolicibacterium sp. CBMA 360]MUL60898.1 hypothetical protein [Mycolicibacterium sp. CBMA 335]MUL71911.1 hypothetical protein [Mycolicibacterium sp. CBMA 311]MUL95839.1 hypothetical protein [Mycolicibacterium sp. CBMA 230]MUM06438.1 hypothetical protein [Mycolicibacterium sp. CBMA 213]
MSASFFVSSPQAKTVAAQLPEITRQVQLTAVSDPLSLIESLLALPGNLVPNAATNAALATPQDLVGGQGGLVTEALTTVWNDAAYLAGIPIQIGVQTAATLLFYGPAAAFHPDLLFSLLTSYIPNYIQDFTARGINGFVSTTTQFLSSLGGLVPAAAAPLAATSVPKVQTNLIKVSKPTAAVSAPNAAAGSKPDKADGDKTGSDTAGTDKTGSGKSGSSNPDSGPSKDASGDSKSGNDSHGSDGPKHSSDKSGSGSHGTGDGHGSTGAHGGSGGNGSGK